MNSISKPNIRVEHWTKQVQHSSLHPMPDGWYCWVYEQDHSNTFTDWMDSHMTGKFECIHRFNGGDDMYTVFIADEKDAAFFALTFLL